MRARRSGEGLTQLQHQVFGAAIIVEIVFGSEGDFAELGSSGGGERDGYATGCQSRLDGWRGVIVRDRAYSIGDKNSSLPIGALDVGFAVEGDLFCGRPTRSVELDAIIGTTLDNEGRESVRALLAESVDGVLVEDEVIGTSATDVDGLDALEARRRAVMVREVQRHRTASAAANIEDERVIATAAVDSLEVKSVNCKAIIAGATIGDVAGANDSDGVGGGAPLEEFVGGGGASDVGSLRRRLGTVGPAIVRGAEALAENKKRIARLRANDKVSQPIPIDITSRKKRTISPKLLVEFSLRAPRPRSLSGSSY